MTNTIIETPQHKQDHEMIQAIAANLSALARAVNLLMAGPLKKKALLILLASSSGQSQASVDKVITALADMEKDWLK